MIRIPILVDPPAEVFIIQDGVVTSAQHVGWMYHAIDGWHALMDYDHVHEDGTTHRAESVMLRPEEVWFTAEEATP